MLIIDHDISVARRQTLLASPVTPVGQQHDVSLTFTTFSGRSTPGIGFTRFIGHFGSTAQSLEALLTDMVAYVRSPYSDGEGDPLIPCLQRDVTLSGYGFYPDSTSQAVLCATFGAQLISSYDRGLTVHALSAVMTEDYFSWGG